LDLAGSTAVQIDDGKRPSIYKGRMAIINWSKLPFTIIIIILTLISFVSTWITRISFAKAELQLPHHSLLQLSLSPTTRFRYTIILDTHLF
jgi:hypothetical protein